jgi:aryl-alcohol dehydrogenase-like predicted oxidoreductase
LRDHASFRSRAQFEEGDFRLGYPRFSEENFPKNVAIADKLGEVGKKYNATPSMISLAWILASSPNCKASNALNQGTDFDSDSMFIYA